MRGNLWALLSRQWERYQLSLVSPPEDQRPPVPARLDVDTGGLFQPTDTVETSIWSEFWRVFWCKLDTEIFTEVVGLLFYNKGGHSGNKIIFNVKVLNFNTFHYTATKRCTSHLVRVLDGNSIYNNVINKSLLKDFVLFHHNLQSQTPQKRINSNTSFV